MALSSLDRATFALDRRAVLTVVINGVTIKGGLNAEGNVDGVDVEFDIEQMPPTAAITFPKEQLTATASGLPPWIMLGHTVNIDAGYGGELARIFTGRVKKRRHGVGEDTLDCVGRTGKLTRPYRVDPPKTFRGVEARAAIIDILDDFGVDFTDAGGEKFDIDPILMNDGNPWILGTVVAAVMDMAPPSDMIHKIADVYGHRMYELPDGTLKIRPLLEAPAMSGFRTYTTRSTGVEETSQNTLTYPDINIDAAVPLGNVAANTRRSQGFVSPISGGVSTVQMWVRRVGAPTDRVRIRIFRDSAGLPSTAADAELATGKSTAALLIALGPDYTAITLNVDNTVQLVAGTTYHLVIDRVLVSGAASPLDAVNYYEVGIDQTAPGYQDGQAGVFGGVTWTAEDAGGDFADHPFEIVMEGFAALRILDIGDDEDEDQIKKLVRVEGAGVPGEDSEGSANVVPVVVTATTDNDDLVVGLDELFAMEYQNDLIDTTQVAGDVALRLIDKFGRVLQSIEVEVPFDPRMVLGSTIAIDDPAVTGLGGNWWVHGYRHSLSSGEAVTRLSLFGGDQSGVTGRLAPQAAFTWTIERELIGNALQAIVTFTAIASDLDGWIRNYRWLDDYAGGANDVQGGDLTSVTFSYNPATDPAITMRLTVTDNDGQATSVEHTIDLQTTNEEVYVPLISCAAGNTCMYSNDGAVSWRDIAIPSGETRTTAIMLTTNIHAAPILLYGTSTGRIYRSVDENASLTLEYTDVDVDRITDIQPDAIRRGLVWATTTDRVLFSIDYGDTWNIYTDFNNSARWPRVTITTVMAAAAIDATIQTLGNNDTRLRWAAQLDPTADGTLGSASFWLQRVGAPADNVRLRLHENASGAPGALLATSNWVAGSTISAVGPVRVSFTLTRSVRTTATYHLVLERSGNPDVVNHYLVSTNNTGVSDFFGFPGVADFDLDVGINGTQTTLAVVAGQGAGAPAVPFYIKIDAEIMLVTARNVDVFTVQRGVLATAGAAHLAAADIFGPRWTALADSIVFDASITGSGGHVNPSPPDPRPINGILISDPSVNRIWIFGGRGSVVESWFATNFLPDGGGLWYSEISQGDGIGAFPRPVTETVTDTVVSHQTSGDLGLMFTDPTGATPSNPYIYSEKFYPVGEAAWAVGGGAMVGAAVDGVSAESNNLQLQTFGAVLNNRNFYVSGDGIGFWPLIDVLPGTAANRPHHLLNITAWRDIFLCAMDEGIAKSIDYGRTWAFLRPVGVPISTTWPVGAIGWRLAIEYRRPRSFNVASIVLQPLAAPAAEAALAIRTKSGGWEDHGPLPTAFIDRPHRLWHFPQISDQVLFTVRYTEAGGFDHSEVLYRTADQGATWVSLGVAPMLFTYAMARGPNGDLWATGESHAGGHFLGGHYAHEIFRSIDNGLTWTLAFSDTSELGGAHAMYKDIAVDPNDQNRIMAVGVYPATNIAVLVTSEATLGTPWTRINTGLSGIEGFAARYCTPFILAGQNERWIIGFEVVTGIRRRIYTNDQDGVGTWAIMYDVTTGGSTFGFADRLRAGNILYVGGAQLAGNVPLLRSLNNGGTGTPTDWEVINSHTDFGSIAWDGVSDILIAGRATGTSPRFPYVQPPDVGAAWQDGIDVGLEAAMGWSANGRAARQGLVIMKPPTAATRVELWAIAQVAAAGGDTDIWLREAISDSWRNYLDMPDTVAAENRFGIYHFPGMGDVMFRLKIGDLGSAANGYGGTLERSANRGLTWVSVLTNVGAVTRAPNGNLWATRDDRAAPASFQPRSIYRSLAADGGLNWQLQATDTTADAGLFTKYTQIRVDPNNSARIMAVGGLGNASTMRYAFSSTGLATPAVFRFASGPMSFRNGVAADGNFINLEAGGDSRFIVGLSQADGLAKFIFVTDDASAIADANWIQKYTVVTAVVTNGWVGSVRAGSDLYLAGNGNGAANAVDGRVVRSQNNGDTWTPFTGSDQTSIMAITWHGGTSTLFIGRQIAGAGNVMKMQNPLPTSVWVADSIPSDPRMIMQEGLKVVA